MHAIGQATKVKSLLYNSVKSVCSAASYDKGRDNLGGQGNEQTEGSCWGDGVMGAQSKVSVPKGWVGCVGGREMGGLGEQKDVCYIGMYLSFQ